MSWRGREQLGDKGQPSLLATRLLFATALVVWAVTFHCVTFYSAHAQARPTAASANTHTLVDASLGRLVHLGVEAPRFTLKALNPAAAAVHPYVSLDTFYKDGANPKAAILLSFFAGYCEPCKREFPLLQALTQHYQSKGLQVLLVSLDQAQDQIALAKTLGETHHATFPLLSDRFRIVGKRYGIEKLPCAVLLDGGGTVRWVHSGFDRRVPAQMHAQVRRLLGISAQQPVPTAIAAQIAAASRWTGAGAGVSKASASSSSQRRSSAGKNLPARGKLKRSKAKKDNKNKAARGQRRGAARGHTHGG